MEINTAVLLVGGKGSRLYPLTKTRPKPLIKFLGKSIIEYQLEMLSKVGVKRIILALNYFSDQIQAKVSEWENKYGFKIIFSKEEIVLGTAGPLKLAERYIEGDSFLVFNSDIYTDVDLKAMIDKFTNANCEAMLLAAIVKDPSKFGLISTERDTVIEFIEKPKEYKNDQEHCINGGMYIFKREILNYVELREMSIEKEVFPIIVKNKQMKIYRHKGIWADIGTPAEYLRGQKEVLEKEKRSNVFIGENVKMGKNVKLDNCVIFDDCTLENNCKINNAMIGNGCIIKEESKINGNDYSIIGDKTEISK